MAGQDGTSAAGPLQRSRGPDQPSATAGMHTPAHGGGGAGGGLPASKPSQGSDGSGHVYRGTLPQPMWATTNHVAHHEIRLIVSPFVVSLY